MEFEAEKIPFFSIGIPTYNRVDMLKQCLLSILGQTFTDFEIIVGNDYTKHTLSSRDFGIEDARIQFVNHTRNLGEIENMNSLLQVSRGRYFTWQFDDDIYSPDFLQSVYLSLTHFDKPKCVYTSYGYIWGDSFPKISTRALETGKILTGRQFLREYLSGRLKVLGCCGVFDSQYLKQTGGVHKLCDSPVGAHSEHFIAIRMGLLDKIAYINRPLVLYRNHEESWSYKTKDADLYKQAGKDFLRETINILMQPALQGDFEHNFSCAVSLSVNTILGKMIVRDGYLKKDELQQYIFSLKRLFDVIKEPVLYETAMSCLQRVERGNRILAVIKAKFKASMPYFLVKFAHIIRAVVSRYK